MLKPSRPVGALQVTICRSWIGTTSGPGAVVSNVKASPPCGVGRHSPAKQNQFLADLREFL
jgi:hypothetical protein